MATKDTKMTIIDPANSSSDLLNDDSIQALLNDTTNEGVVESQVGRIDVATTEAPDATQEKPKAVSKKTTKKTTDSKKERTTTNLTGAIPTEVVAQLDHHIARINKGLLYGKVTRNQMLIAAVEKLVTQLDKEEKKENS